MQCHKILQPVPRLRALVLILVLCEFRPYPAHLIMQIHFQPVGAGLQKIHTFHLN